MALVALGHGTAQLLQRDRHEITTFGHGLGHQFDIAAAAGK
jgi:hypothetical protein